MRTFATKSSAEPSATASSKGISLPAVPVYQAVQPIQMALTHYGESEKEVITTAKALKETIEDILDNKFDGVRALFLQNSVAKSQDQWADLLFEYLDGDYDLRGGLNLQSVKNAVKAVKNDIRNDTLLHYTAIAFTEMPPYSVDNLTEELTRLGTYLDDDDDTALEAIVETEGKFAATKVQIAPGNLELRDEDNIVSVIDSHQNKHQKAKIADFDPYTGAPGSKFSSDKDLDWHRDHTAVTVAEITQEAIEAGDVGPDTGTFSPSKAPREDIIYDIAISYDHATGKYVAAYHCNPVEEEDD